MWGVVEDQGTGMRGRIIDKRQLLYRAYIYMGIHTYRCPICASLDKRLNDFGAAKICSLGGYHASEQAGEWASGRAGEWVDSQACGWTVRLTSAPANLVLQYETPLTDRGDDSSE